MQFAEESSFFACVVCVSCQLDRLNLIIELVSMAGINSKWRQETNKRHFRRPRISTCQRSRTEWKRTEVTVQSIRSLLTFWRLDYYLRNTENDRSRIRTWWANSIIFTRDGCNMGNVNAFGYDIYRFVDLPTIPTNYTGLTTVHRDFATVIHCH